MKISVIIPTLNMAGSLKRAIDSALPQAHEVMVVDDASSDATPAVLAGIRHPKLKTFRHSSNLGVCAARNNAVLQATGDWFVPLDADDALADNVLATLRAAADARTFVYGDWLEAGVNELGYTTRLHKRAAEIGMIDRKNVAKATFLFSRSMWETVGGYDDDFETTGAEDWAFMMALVEAGFKGVRVEIPVYYYEPSQDGRAAKVSQHEGQIKAMLRQKYPRTMGQANGNGGR